MNSVTSLDVSGFDTSHVTTMYDMFKGKRYKELKKFIGTQTIKGVYDSETQIHQGHLFVNDKLFSKGGSFTDGAISYYVKVDQIKADDLVTMNFYDVSGNLLAEN